MLPVPSFLNSCTVNPIPPPLLLLLLLPLPLSYPLVLVDCCLLLVVGGLLTSSFRSFPPPPPIPPSMDVARAVPVLTATVAKSALMVLVNESSFVVVVPVGIVPYL